MSTTLYMVCLWLHSHTADLEKWVCVGLRDTSFDLCRSDLSETILWGWLKHGWQISGSVKLVWLTTEANSQSLQCPVMSLGVGTLCIGFERLCNILLMAIFQGRRYCYVVLLLKHFNMPTLFLTCVCMSILQPCQTATYPIVLCPTVEQSPDVAIRIPISGSSCLILSMHVICDILLWVMGVQYCEIFALC